MQFADAIALMVLWLIALLPVAAIALIRATVMWINNRDDPRRAKLPPDAP